MLSRRLHLPAYRRAAALAVLVLALFGNCAAFAAELLAVGRERCPHCGAWEIEVGRTYDRTPEARIAPLRRVHIDDVSALNYDFDEPVRYTPTFILVERGREIGRIVGYSEPGGFWDALGALLRHGRVGAGRRLRIPLYAEIRTPSALGPGSPSTR